MIKCILTGKPLSAQEEARIRTSLAKLPSVAAKLATIPHPTTNFASKGTTLLDYVVWSMKTGREKNAAFMIESAVANSRH